MREVWIPPTTSAPHMLQSPGGDACPLPAFSPPTTSLLVAAANCAGLPTASAASGVLPRYLEAAFRPPVPTVRRRDIAAGNAAGRLKCDSLRTLRICSPGARCRCLSARANGGRRPPPTGHRNMTAAEEILARNTEPVRR